MGIKTLTDLSYGLSTPSDLLIKMKSDGQKIEPDYDKYNIFNFIVTAAVLNEWIMKYYNIDENSLLFKAVRSCCKDEINEFPKDTTLWIIDTSCLPNDEYDLRVQIQECISICHHVSNASKHFHWQMSKGPKITAIEKEPEIKDEYQWMFTKCGPGLYIEYDKAYYCITQIRDILIQFYSGFISYLEDKIR